jgi:hypothetical protein
MMLNFKPLGWSRHVGTTVKDGVLLQRGFQPFCAKVCFLAFILRFHSRSLSTLVACVL